MPTFEIAEPPNLGAARAFGTFRRTFSLRDTGVFVVISALHVVAIYYLASLMPIGHESLWSSLDVSFIPRQKPVDPPPPPPMPELLDDAFNETPLMEIPAPEVQVDVPQEASRAIHIQAPAPPEEVDPEPAPAEGDQGFGPITKPRVVSRPRIRDRYPPASVYYRESGRPVVKICISEEGHVTNVELAQSSGYHRLDEAAVDLGWDYVFAPATREGKPVAVCLPYGVTFRINIGGIRHRR
ncbi:MAG TPA: energy transducer TonB [Steroidobacteraceae bacterium]|jgi:protein TonB|nr:energy transducer TonB [Steroidobacteraceae bacterium]